MPYRARPLIRRGGIGKHSPGACLLFGSALVVLMTCNNVWADPNSSLRTSTGTAFLFNRQEPSPEVTHAVRWIIASADNHGMPFAIVDKVKANVFVFDAGGRLQGADAALLGLARGDRSAAGIRDRKVSDIRPEDRITPAGRFLVSLDHDIHGKEILLIDYDAAIALHAVVKGTPIERRAQRLSSATAQDNRISYGCINVPLTFYQQVVSPAFTGTSGVVYILPESSKASGVSGLYEIDTVAPRRMTTQ
jgi:hypothetical protein